MNASFEEKSVWIQLFGLSVVLVLYFGVAGVMLANGVTLIVPYVPLFIAATVLLVVTLIAGHLVAASTSRPEARDERDRLVGWRAEAHTGWVLGVGVLLAVGALVVAIDRVWVVHLLLASLFLAEIAKCALQLVYYRRGL